MLVNVLTYAVVEGLIRTDLWRERGPRAKRGFVKILRIDVLRNPPGLSLQVPTPQ